jgi:hypothetical protein
MDQTALLTPAKPMMIPPNVQLELNASGMQQGQQNALMMSVILIRLIHHVKQM